MRKNFARLVLVLVALGGLAAAGYHVYWLEQRNASVQSADRAFAEDAIRLQATLADLRAAQAGYVATGQDTALWIAKVAQLRQQAEAQLKRLEAAAPEPETEGDLATVGEALASIGRFDKRIADLLRDEQPVTASSLIFSDSAQVAAAAAASLSGLRASRSSKAGAAVVQLRKQELYAGGGALLLLLVVLAVLVPLPRKPVEDRVEAVESGSETPLFAPVPAVPFGSGGSLDLELGLERPGRRGEELAAFVASQEGESSRVHAAEVVVDAASAGARAGLLDGRPAAAGQFAGAQAATAADAEADAALPSQPDLVAAAQLCTDLARVRDTSELAGLLARAATLLDASGIVVWMGGVEGDVLWPAFSHGYSPQTLSRMQALPRDGRTPVSVAFRSGAMEVVPAGSGTSGAIVAPILTSSGCVGVMAVEIRHGAETSAAEQSLASILAAQLATLVAGESE